MAAQYDETVWDGDDVTTLACTDIAAVVGRIVLWFMGVTVIFYLGIPKSQQIDVQKAEHKLPRYQSEESRERIDQQ